MVFRRFRRLHWKLAFSYALVTTAVFLTLSLLSMVFIFVTVESSAVTSWLPFIGISTGGALLLYLVIGSLYGYFASRNLVRRLNQLGRSAAQWAQGQFDAKVMVQSNDEIGDLERNLNQMADQLQTLVVTRQQLGALDERSRIARELHDTVKQQVFATQMQLSSARLIIEQDPTQAAEILDATIELNEQIQYELIALIEALRPAELKDIGLAKALETYVTSWGMQVNVATDLLIRNERELPLDVEFALYRVAQEVLANIAKHANAQCATLQLTYLADAIRLQIDDDGLGIDPEKIPAAGYGLASIRERLAEFKGQLSIIRNEENGVSVVATIPLS